MIDDPNLVYKSAYRDLADKLGRAPTVNEAFPLMEGLRKAWETMPAQEPTRTRPASKGLTRRGLSARAANGSARAREGGQADTRAEGALIKPGRGEEGQEGGMSGRGESEAGGPAEGAVVTSADRARVLPSSSTAFGHTRLYRVGERGGNGGKMAKCEGCGEWWEREVKRGRPSGKCEECR